MFTVAQYARLGLATCHAKVLAGERLSQEDGLALFNSPDLLAVGALAHYARLQRHGRATYYVRNRHINYSNVCVTRCRFCAFRREQGEEGFFTLSHEDILARIADDQGQPFSEIHVVGGCHPTLRLGWFEDLFHKIQKLRPHSMIKAFTVVEIDHFARQEGISTSAVLSRLQAAGLRMLTGGGAEIFNPAVRARICPEKIPGTEYLRIAGEAHAKGIASNCTMLFGHVESLQDRVEHLCALREQQDISGGFLCFIPLAFQPRHNALSPEVAVLGKNTGSGLDQLRTIAVSRLLLDTIPHIKAYWVMLGLKQAQLALSFGADDIDGTIMEEHIGHMAGAASSQALTRHELESMITGCGFEPVNRDALYTNKAQVTVPQSGQIPALQNVTGKALLQEPPAVQVLIGKLRAAFPVWKQCQDAQQPLPVEARLNPTEAALLYHEAGLHTLGLLAHEARQVLHPQAIVTYVADRNINYSNVCVCACRFCAFYRPPGNAEGYVLSREDLDAKIRETLALGGTQILLQGGHHPDLPLSFYEDMIAWMRTTHPSIHIHAFSPPEIAFFAEKEGLPEATVLARLIQSGLHSIPGGGAEILVDRVRRQVSPNKCSTATWLGIMRKAHEQGLRTTATMMFGHEETKAERLEHLFALRDLQDTTRGFTAFIPWTFQPANTQIQCTPATSQEYLRLLAVSRLVLDVVPNIQASWVTMGPDVAQLALLFGANDFGSLMIEENVVAAAGVNFRLSREEIHQVIKRAGFEPRQRYMDYTLIGA